jgi:hypothetical protein
VTPLIHSQKKKPRQSLIGGTLKEKSQEMVKNSKKKYSPSKSAGNKQLTPSKNRFKASESGTNDIEDEEEIALPKNLMGDLQNLPSSNILRPAKLGISFRLMLAKMDGLKN